MTLDLAEATVAGSIITALAGGLIAFVRAAVNDMKNMIDENAKTNDAEISKLWAARDVDIRDATGFRTAMLTQIGNVPTRTEFQAAMDRQENRILSAISRQRIERGDQG